jgi:hypothetical protein
MMRLLAREYFTELFAVKALYYIFAFLVTLQVCIGIQDGQVYVFSLGGVDSTQQAPGILFQHSLQNIIRYSQAYSNHCTFMYLLRDTVEPLLYCYLYQAADPNDVSTRFVFRVNRSHGNSPEC